jgi:hypothetical protein
MKVAKSYQKEYIKHIQDLHQSQFTPEEFKKMEFEIRRLKLEDVCPELPEPLKIKKQDTVCVQCNLKFIFLYELHVHNEKVHGIPNPNPKRALNAKSLYEQSL